MKKIVDKEKLIRLTELEDSTIDPFATLAYSFPEEEGILQILLKNNLTRWTEDFFIIPKYFLNCNPTENDVPLILENLDVLLETENVEFDDVFFLSSFETITQLLILVGHDVLIKHKDELCITEDGKEIFALSEKVHSHIEDEPLEIISNLHDIGMSLFNEYVKSEEDQNDEHVLDLEEQGTVYKYVILKRKHEFEDACLQRLANYENTSNIYFTLFTIEVAGFWRSEGAMNTLMDILRNSDTEAPFYEATIQSLKLLQSEKFKDFAEEAYQFKSDYRGAVTDVLGAYPFDWSEKLLLKYVFKEKTNDYITLMVNALSDMYSKEAIPIILDFYKKNKIDEEIRSLDELLVPLYVYHDMEIPEWLLDLN